MTFIFILYHREDAEKMAAQALIANRSQNDKTACNDRNENSELLAGHAYIKTPGRYDKMNRLIVQLCKVWRVGKLLEGPPWT